MSGYKITEIDETLPYYLAVDESGKGHGRSIYASRDIQAGSLIIEEEPFCFIVATPFEPIVCANCCIIASEGSIYALGPVDPVRYCSLECLKADNVVHLMEIGSNVFLQTQEIQGGNNDSLRLIIRLASMKAKMQEDCSHGGSTVISPLTFPMNGKSNSIDHILSLEAVCRQMKEDDRDDIRRVAEVLAEAIDEGGLSLSCSEVERCIYLIQSNAHRIIDEGDRPVALGIFPLTSMMNHSCVPNCSHYFITRQGCSPRLIMRAFKDVKKDEELVYSYVPQYDSRSSRQELLRQAYGFTCDCIRCTSDGLSKEVYPLDSELNGRPGVHPRSCKVSNEIMTCESIVYQDPSASPRIYKKLLSLLGSHEKLTDFSPAHKMLLNAYILLGRCGLEILEHTKDEVEGEVVCKQSVYYCLLAFGLINYFTRSESIELVSILLVLTKCLEFCEKHGFVNMEKGGGLAVTIKSLISSCPSSYAFGDSSLVKECIHQQIDEIFSCEESGHTLVSIVRTCASQISERCRGCS